MNRNYILMYILHLSVPAQRGLNDMWKIKRLKEINLRRAIKFQYLKLLRSPGGARKVATGFAVGFGLEMLVPMTAMAIYLLFYPLVRLLKGSFPAAVIGNIIGKITILPVMLVPLATKLGNFMVPHRPHHIPAYIYFYLKTLTGMSIFAAVLGILAFFPAYFLYRMNQQLRLKKREKRRQLRTQMMEHQ